MAAGLRPHLRSAASCASYGGAVSVVEFPVVVLSDCAGLHLHLRSAASRVSCGVVK